MDALSEAVFVDTNPIFLPFSPSQLCSQQFLCKALWIPRRTNEGPARSTEADRELPVKRTKLSRGN